MNLTKQLAQDIARKLLMSGPIKWDEVREFCDLQTNGEMAAKQLDMLTDLVSDMIRKPLAT